MARGAARCGTSTADDAVRERLAPHCGRYGQILDSQSTAQLPLIERKERLPTANSNQLAIGVLALAGFLMARESFPGAVRVHP